MTSSRRIVTSAVAVATAAFVLTGCQFFADDSSSEESALDAFYEQTPAWTDAGDSLDSTTVTVPLDWAAPDGDSIKIAIMRHRATEKSLGSLLINPGGPGQSGFDFVRDFAEYAVSPDVLANFDLIGFDPRGVNHSTPVTCYTDDVDKDEVLYGTYDVPYGTQEWVDELTQREKDYAAACKANTGPLLAHVDAGSVARDMDVIRAVLGDEKINYLGYSYGTYLGAVYAEIFPDKVGRMVLDGAVDPLVDALDALATQMAGFDSALAAYMAECLQNDPTCPFTGSTVDGLRQMRELLGSVDGLNLMSADGRELDSATLGTAIAYNLYSDQYWPGLTSMLMSLKAGDVQPTFDSADGYNGRDSDGSYADNSADVYAAVTCAEGTLGTDGVSTLDSVRKLRARAPILGDYFAYDDTAVSDALCSNWPYPVAKLPTTFDAQGAPPILVIGTTNDPATPYAQAVSLSKQLSSGVLISYEGEGHTIYAQGVPCIDDAVDAYFIVGTVPSADPMC